MKIADCFPPIFEQFTPSNLFASSLRLALFSLTESIRDSWQTAHRETYGDHCEHPRASLIPLSDVGIQSGGIRCNQCGRIASKLFLLRAYADLRGLDPKRIEQIAGRMPIASISIEIADSLLPLIPVYAWHINHGP